jgi:YidC/Oxa1 family membrane protein insertase
MDFILNPFVTLLTFLYSIFANNMLLAIVVFTVIVRLLTYPLTVTQMRSSQAMQKLQPELKKIQEKYKGDREKLSQEQMRLYREYGINPLGGCLPLLIQFPIFIALYQAIIHALAATPMQLLDLSGRLLIPGLDSNIPLQNKWLGMDLTQPPVIAGADLASIVGIVLVALVVVTTWLQFKVTMPANPPSDDGKPNQAQAMSQSMGTIMPLMYGFFALSFSIGISVYFIASNVIGIVQYALMGRANFGNIFGRGGKATASSSAPAATSSTSANGAAPTKIQGKASKPRATNGKGKPTERASKTK